MGVETGVAVGKGVRVAVGVDVGVLVRVGVALGFGVGASPSTVKTPAFLKTSPTKICTTYSPGSHAEGSGCQSVKPSPPDPPFQGSVS